MTAGPGNTTGSKYKDAAKQLGAGSLVGKFAATDVDLIDPAHEIKLENSIDTNAEVFKLGSKTGENLRQNFGRAVSNGALSADQVSVTLGGTAASATARALKDKEEKEKKEKEDRAFRDAMQRINDRIRDLEKDMQAQIPELERIFGKDYVGGMASKHLSEEQLSKAKTQDERMKLLAEKMLNPDGTLKKEYENTPEGKYVKAWYEREKAKELAAEGKALNGKMTPEYEKKVDDFAKNSELSAKREFLDQSNDKSSNDKVVEATNTQYASVNNTKIDMNSSF